MSSKDLKIYDEKEIKDKLQKGLDSWNYDGKWIRKVFKTHSWKGTLMAINTIGHLAEVAWHHPDLVVSYAFVEVKLMTHDKKGITDLDFELAKKIDNVVQWNPNSENGPFEGTPKDPRFAYIKL
tara:strand:+ start:1145 stop:1516 length:372 start_codon:yes stop_codon:yes gene_type:complete